MTLLSVVVPISRLAGELVNLESWLQKTLDYEVEIILIHDFQDSQTSLELREIIDSIKNSNIILIEGRFGSPGEARNIGLLSTSGLWVMFWDGDDVGDVDVVMTELREPRSSDFDAIVFQYDIRRVNQSITKFQNINKSKTNDLESIAVNPGLWRICLKGHLARTSKFPSLSMAEDQIFLAEINFAKLKIFFSEKIAYHYYVGRLGQLTKNPVAINDLRETIIFLKSKITQAEDLFLVILVLRQSVTAIRRGRLKLKIFAAFEMINVLIDHPCISLKALRVIKARKYEQ